MAWSKNKFKQKIYNDEYIKIDPDYLTERPKIFADILIGMFKEKISEIKHLDYGGGNGLLSKLLTREGFYSNNYDPFDANGNTPAGQYNLITAFEVFEHVPDPKKLFEDLSSLLAEDGMIIFSTLLSDKHITDNGKLDWWYASPRNGHISLFSRRSITLMAEKFTYQFGSFDNGMHVLCKKIPQWASHLTN
tara:strand:- start:162 stop:734 length:573 start_codon:yes stop_codon:yes gene_type:complete